MSLLRLPILKTSSDAKDIELFNALSLLEQKLDAITNAKVKPTNNQNNDYYISEEPL
jgi:hypothetical protein